MGFGKIRCSLSIQIMDFFWQNMGSGQSATAHFRRGCSYAFIYMGSQKPETECADQSAGASHRPSCNTFGVFWPASFPNMEGRPLRPVLEKDQLVREGALFGIFGGQVCCTDGNWVYMRSPISGNSPRYEYTLMPTCHGEGERLFRMRF